MGNREEKILILTFYSISPREKKVQRIRADKGDQRQDRGISIFSTSGALFFPTYLASRATPTPLTSILDMLPE